MHFRVLTTRFLDKLFNLIFHELQLPSKAIKSEEILVENP